METTCEGVMTAIPGALSSAVIFSATQPIDPKFRVSFESGPGYLAEWLLV